MKITKRYLERIIKEEKARLVREMNPDGTISADEEEARDDFMADVEMQIDELVNFINTSSADIGGGFRGPGIKAEAYELLLSKIPARYRKSRGWEYR